MAVGFTQTFKKLLISVSLCGIYIPGTDYTYVSLCLCLIAAVAHALGSIDTVLLWITGGLKSYILTFLIFRFMIYLWSLLKNCYFLSMYKYMTELFDFWVSTIDSKVESEMRKKRIQQATRKTFKIFIYYCIGFGMPYIVIAIMKIFVTHSLIVPSILHLTMNDTAPFGLVIFQSSSMLCLVAQCCSFPTIVMLMMNIVYAELDHLEECLRNLVGELQVDSSGAVKKSDGSVHNRDSNKWYSDLSSWINQHARVTEFQRKANKFFGPLIFGEYFYLTTNIAGLTFSAISGHVPMQMVFNALVFVSFVAFTTYRLCDLGDKIIEKSSRISEVALMGNWMAFPINFQHNLRLICMMSRKPMTFSLKGHTTLSSMTFRRIAFRQYQFLRFMKDST